MELTLFIIVGAIAVLSAAMMLISENAIYSALFLILNFACIAFFFLMLNAAFLAMVQIAVYAGAIMVLFLFVIMLLGAERVPPGEPFRFRYLTPAAVVLALIFLLTASAAIISGEIELTEPRDTAPYLRAVHALDGVDAIDVYVDGELLARDVVYQDASDFEMWDTGEYAVTVVAAGAGPDAEPLVEKQVTLDPDMLVSLVLVGRNEDVQLAVAAEDVSFNDDSNKLRVTLVNALPDWDVVDVRQEGSESVLVENLAYGEASASKNIYEGTPTIGVYPPGDDESEILLLQGEAMEASTSVLVVFTEQHEAQGNRYMNTTFSLATQTRPSFGSPTHVGQLLFSKYVLPFEMVALLLLVAMIGAIVLTHESLHPRRTIVRRLAHPPAGLEQPITGEPGQQ